MRTRFTVATSAILLGVSTSWAQPLGTTFTYQGQLRSGGSAASGPHDLRFRLYDAATGGDPIGPELCHDNVDLSDGLFTVALDFGAQFAGQQRFLEIDVRADAGLGCGDATGFVTLVPRQSLSGVPNALFALNTATATNATQLNNQPASFYQSAANLVSGTLADARLSSNVALLNAIQTFSARKIFSVAPTFAAAAAPFTVGSTEVVTNLNADYLDGLSSSSFLQAGDTAGGDLGGTYPNPAVVRLQGRAVSPTAPTTGQVLKWDGAAWAPGSDAGGSLTLPFSGSAEVNPGGVFSITNTASSGVSDGVRGITDSPSGAGVFGNATSTVASGASYGGYFHSASPLGAGVFGFATHATATVEGVSGQSSSTSGRGVFGIATADSGFTFGGLFRARSPTGVGVSGYAQSTTGAAWGVVGDTESTASNGYGVVGIEPGLSAGHAVYAFGTLAATGTKSFQIDHPLDPENAYLQHFCTEGPEPMNAYSGNVVSDAQGYATIQLPDYFESINRDFRYQLTVVDGAGEEFVQVRVVRKIHGNQFTIRTSAPHVEVSWRVEAVRNDAWVRRYGYQTVLEKEPEIKGRYLHPELYGAPAEASTLYHADRERALCESSRPARAGAR